MGNSSNKPERHGMASGATAVKVAAPLIPLVITETAGTAGVAGLAGLGVAGGGLVVGAVARHRPRNQRRSAERSVRRTERARQHSTKGLLGASNPRTGSRRAAGSSKAGSPFGASSANRKSASKTAAALTNGKTAGTKKTNLGGAANSKAAGNQKSGVLGGKTGAKGSTSKSGSTGASSSRNGLLGGGTHSSSGGSGRKTAGHNTSRGGTRSTANSGSATRGAGSQLGSMVFGRTKTPGRGGNTSTSTGSGSSRSGRGGLSASMRPSGGSTAQAVRQTERATRAEKRRSQHARRKGTLTSLRRNRRGQVTTNQGERRITRGSKNLWNVAIAGFLLVGSSAASIFYWTCLTGHHAGNRLRSTHADMVSALKAPYSGITADWHQFRQSRHERRYAILRAAGETHPVIDVDDDEEGDPMQAPGKRTNLRNIIEAIEDAPNIGDAPHLTTAHQWFHDLEEMAEKLSKKLRIDSERVADTLPPEGAAHEITAEMAAVMSTAASQFYESRIGWEKAEGPWLERMYSEHPGEAQRDVSTADEN